MYTVFASVNHADCMTLYGCPTCFVYLHCGIKVYIYAKLQSFVMNEQLSPILNMGIFYSITGQESCCCLQNKFQQKPETDIQLHKIYST